MFKPGSTASTNAREAANIAHHQRLIDRNLTLIELNLERMGNNPTQAQLDSVNNLRDKNQTAMNNQQVRLNFASFDQNAEEIEKKFQEADKNPELFEERMDEIDVLLAKNEELINKNDSFLGLNSKPENPSTAPTPSQQELEAKTNKIFNLLQNQGIDLAQLNESGTVSFAAIFAAIEVLSNPDLLGEIKEEMIGTKPESAPPKQDFGGINGGAVTYLSTKLPDTPIGNHAEMQDRGGNVITPSFAESVQNIGVMVDARSDPTTPPQSQNGNALQNIAEAMQEHSDTIAIQMINP